MAINAKREQIRDQIRKKEREAFFMQQRLKNIGNILPPISNQNLAQQLRQKINVEETLQAIIGKVSASNHVAVTMRLIEQGLIPVVFQYLQEERYLVQTLQILSFLIENFPPKPHFYDVYSQLYNLGILEQLSKHLNNNHGGTLSAFIIYRYSQASEDYCEAIFESRLYELLMRQTISLEHSPYSDISSDDDPQRFTTYVLKILQNLVETKQSVMNYSPQKREILGFVQFLLSKRLFLRHAFAIIYEAVRVDRGLMSQNLIALINEIMGQAQPDSKYMHNLLATVYILTPDPAINYPLCFKISIQIPKTYRLLSLILERLTKNYYQALPTHELFWEKIMAGSAHDEETFKRLVRVAAKLGLNQALVCRIISVSLQKQCSLSIQKQGLEMLENFVKTEDHLDSKLLELNKQGILQMLSQLCECSSLKVKEKANWVLEYILGPMTEMAERIESP